jgi:hypothetical protein
MSEKTETVETPVVESEPTPAAKKRSWKRIGITVGVTVAVIAGGVAAVAVCSSKKDEKKPEALEDPKFPSMDTPTVF